jgi:ribosomal protein S18 acetylase RimI-like enzyme
MPDPSETVRRANAADAEVLARLRFEFRAGIADAVEDEASFLARCSGWMRERLESASPWIAWVASDAGGAVFGAVWVQLVEKIPNPVGEPERHAYLSNLFVRPSQRGRGHGSRLLSVALDECDRRGADAVFLWPTPESRSLYARHGFTAAGGRMERRSWHAL